jgi:hypothetical protein
MTAFRVSVLSGARLRKSRDDDNVFVSLLFGRVYMLNYFEKESKWWIKMRVELEKKIQQSITLDIHRQYILKYCEIIKTC